MDNMDIRHKFKGARVDPGLDYSQIYGINRESFEEFVGEGGLRKMTMDFLKTFPATAHINGIRKAKTRAMVNAMINGVSDNGNHLITCFGNVYHFYYRGTLIYKWDAINDVQVSVPAGQYEDTASTRNQRKEIQKAIENFKTTVFRV